MYAKNAAGASFQIGDKVTIDNTYLPELDGLQGEVEYVDGDLDKFLVVISNEDNPRWWFGFHDADELTLV